MRKYSGDQDLIWGGNHCGHEWGEIIKVTGHKAGETNPGKEGYTKDAEQWSNNRGGFCSLCGTWRGAYGLEPTPELYVQHTIEILREIRRVLRKDGVVFWNIGDSYGSGFSTSDNKYKAMSGAEPDTKFKTGVKPKDLCLIPFRVAIAAQEDGWWVRSVIIWSKPNPMPESVKDRPTESHEYILMLTKSARYYWDMDAVREPQSPHTLGAFKNGIIPRGPKSINNPADIKQGLTKQSMTEGREWMADMGGRNIRSVWEFPTQPYPDAHFAVFPEKLPEICIKAASKEGDVILDPFAGAGTTLYVAKKLNRKAIGFDLSEEYSKLTVERCRQQVML